MPHAPQRLTRHWSAPVAAAGIAVALGAPALSATSPQAGSWKLTVTIERDGKTQSSAPKTTCLTAAELKQPEMGIAPTPNEIARNCQRTVAKTAAGLSWQIVCQTKSSLTEKTTVTFDNARHFSGTTEQVLTSANGKAAFILKRRFDAQWTGECKP
jgi:hypothetical protein